jgi:hypothetical protein
MKPRLAAFSRAYDSGSYGVLVGFIPNSPDLPGVGAHLLGKNYNLSAPGFWFPDTTAI